MLSIIEYEEYLPYLNDRIASLPNKGRGEPARWSRLLGISTVAMSHILKGRNLLNLDQGLRLSNDFSFDVYEKEYFLKLIELERASTKELRDYLRGKLFDIKKKANDLENVVLKQGVIDDQALGEFYSDWTYSAFRLLSAIDEFKTTEEICDYFDLSLDRGKKIRDFLLTYGLLKKVGGELRPAMNSTHLNKDSPYINNHRRNWRLKGIEKLKDIEDEDIFYSSPFVLGENEVAWLREQIKFLLKELQSRVEASPCETLVCLNIDLFKF